SSWSARTAFWKSAVAASAWLGSRPPPSARSRNARMPSSVAACDALGPRPRGGDGELVVEPRPHRDVPLEERDRAARAHVVADAEQALREAPRDAGRRVPRRAGAPGVVARQRALPAPDVGGE